jgi:hypothetical protein
MTPEDYKLLEQAAHISQRTVSDYSRLALLEYVKQDLGIEDETSQRKPLGHPLRKTA